MENNLWNNKKVSLDKGSLSEEETEVNLDVKKTRSMVKDNEVQARKFLRSFPDLDEDVVSFFEANTLNDGSIDISNIQLTSPFFKEEGMCFNSGQTVTTRGYNYVCSLDDSLTSIQKIKKYQETVHLVMESLKNTKLDKIEKLLLLDYLKNSLITILNSFIFQEKLDPLSVDTSEGHDVVRSELIKSVETVIRCSINLLLNKNLNEIEVTDLEDIPLIVNKAVDKLENYHLKHKLPSFYVSRPEATHPLTIMGASLLCAERYKSVDTMVGVPSGGTEFAFTTKVFMNKLGNRNVRLILIPISLHSFKQFSNENGNGDNEAIKLSIKKYFGDNVGSVLICDDNTSTGRTLQLLKDSILDIYPDIKIYCTVAEADITRSQIDKDDNKRTHIANKDIYLDAVNILPVSKSIHPKVDLKEIIEKRKIISYYRSMQEKSLNLVDKIYAEVMSRVDQSGVDYASFLEENTISNFRGTFLSNFYAVSIKLNGQTYPSVEHAYQATKFSTIDWNLISQETKDEIHETLKLRGYAASIVYGNDLFTDSKMTSGNIKIIADILRKYGHVDKEWEDKRVKLMISLLLQKFETEEIKIKLQETNEKKLIEGNDWGDTLWGVCDGRGRNILGIILMEIRKLGKEKE
jgi:hypothetical protein